jgi:hypothetical protein
MTNGEHHRQPHPRYSIDVSRMYDLQSTTKMAELLALRIEDRSDRWTEELLGAVWNGSIEIPDTAFFEGPDGFTYLRLDVPKPGQAPDRRHRISSVRCLSHTRHLVDFRRRVIRIDGSKGARSGIEPHAT